MVVIEIELIYVVTCNVIPRYDNLCGDVCETRDSRIKFHSFQLVFKEEKNNNEMLQVITQLQL